MFNFSLKASKREYVHKMFDSIASDYDFMNEIISFGRNRIIKKRVIKNVPLKDNSRILDICTGTGDLAIYLAGKFPDSKIIALDFSANMLKIAKKKAKNINNIEFIEGDALNLPFSNEEFDACFVGYGLRNLENVEKGISEMARVIKPGGYAVNLDFGKPKGIVNKLFRLYFFYIVPLLGKLVHGHLSPYRYLPESTKEFPSPESLMSIFKKSGFSEVKNYNFAFGALAQQIARK